MRERRKRKRKRKRSRSRRRRRRRREEELADRKGQDMASMSMELADQPNLASVRDRGQRQRQWAEVRERVG